MITCKTCNGTGEGGGFDRNSSHTEGRYVEYSCRDCGGRGARNPKLKCPRCGSSNSYGGDPETYPCSRCGFDGRMLETHQ